MLDVRRAADGRVNSGRHEKRLRRAWASQNSCVLEARSLVAALDDPWSLAAGLARAR